MKKPIYRVIVTYEDGYSSLILQTFDLIEAETELGLMIKANLVPNILIKYPEYTSIRLEKSEVIKSVEFGDGQ